MSVRGQDFSCPRRGCRRTSCSNCWAATGCRCPRCTCCTWRPGPARWRSGSADRVGDFTPGKDFDAVWLRPADGSTYAVNLAHAADTTDALARTFALATPADVAGVWVRGQQVGLEQAHT